MAISEELQRKRELVIKTINREETVKVPFFLIADQYVPFYCGKTPGDIKTYEQALAVDKQFYDDLHYDVTLDPLYPNNAFTEPLLEQLGGGAHVVQNGVKQINPESVRIMKPEDYDGLIQDPVNYLLDEILPRRYSLLSCDDHEKMKRWAAIMEQLDALSRYLSDFAELGIPLMTDQCLYFNPVDFIFDVLRDFTGMSMDLRRRPEAVRDAGLAMVDLYASFTKYMVEPRPYSAIQVPMHLPPFIRPDVFEKVYLPSFLKLTEAVTGQGHNIVFCFEKNYSHLYDYLQELPKHGIIGIFEEDDMHVVKEKLGPVMAVAGGLSTNLLRYGTKEECIDNCKQAIDELAPGGGYFITNDVPLMFKNDAKPENLKAVADYLNEERYKA